MVRVSTVACLVTTSELVKLFAGDDLSEGYPSQAIAYAICMRIQPDSATALKNRIYGHDVDCGLITWRAREAMARGYAAWADDGKPTH